LNLARADGQQYLSRVQTTLPAGLLGRIAAVTPCPETQANLGTCPPSSQIGTAAVGAGAGPGPLELPGSVYLTGPYGGAPYGLSIAVPAESVGPFDYGTVVARAKIEVDPHSARVTVSSDPLPTIVGGAPLRLKTLTIAAGEQFMINPTSCRGSTSETLLTSTLGATQSISTPFQASGCASLPFTPTLSASTSAQASKQSGASLEVQLSYPAARQANVASVSTTLPAQLPVRLTTLQQACPEAIFASNPGACPTGSQVGQASVLTPILPAPLGGPAYLVSNGGAAFPDLDVILSGDGLRLMLHGQTNIKAGVITTTFPALPDVPLSRFSLNLPQGPYSALGTIGPLCGETLIMPTTITAQNGKQITQQTRIAVTGCPAAAGAGSLLSGLRIAPARFSAAAGGTSISSVPPARGRHRGRRAKVSGATVSYNDALAATTTFVVLRPARGETRGKRCVARTRRRHRGRTCSLAVAVGSFSHRDVVGANRFHFSGRVGRRKLPPGSYTLQASAISAGAQHSATISVRFSIKR
jgi:hypothetical protein